MGPLICCDKNVTDNYGAHQNTKLDLKKEIVFAAAFKTGFLSGHCLPGSFSVTLVSSNNFILCGRACVCFCFS